MIAVRTANCGEISAAIDRLAFGSLPRLRWVHSAAAGVGSALHDEMRHSDVLLTNSAGVHAIPIAEYVVAGILHFLRGFDVAIAQQREGKWDKTFFVAPDAPLREMDSVRALIVGTGGLGGETAKRLSGLGATCTGVRRRVELGPPTGFQRVVALSTTNCGMRIPSASNSSNPAGAQERLAVLVSPNSETF